MADSYSRIRIAWWNTSLAPNGVSRMDGNQWKKASSVIKALVSKYEIDILALGEIANGQLRRFVKENALSGFQVHETLKRDGNLQFDSGLIYKESKFKIEKSATITTNSKVKRHKVGEHIEIQETSSGEVFAFFVSHWPSRLHCSDSFDRYDLGTALRTAVDAVFGSNASKSNVVLLGDYNDEPYDASIALALRSTRDLRLVQKKGQFLYNPFWRHLGEPSAYVQATEQIGFPGTIHHSNGSETKWRTFDQIIFSSSFVTTGEWQLNEEQTAVLQMTELLDDVIRANGVFNHFPVMGTLLRKERPNA